MTEQPDEIGLPPDAPAVGTMSIGWIAALAAVTGLVLVALAAFWLIGTQPQSAAGADRSSVVRHAGNGATANHPLARERATSGP